MSAPVLAFPAIALDANGLPVRHHEAKQRATETLRHLVNELPDSFYRLGEDDAEWIASAMLQAYLHELRDTR